MPPDDFVHLHVHDEYSMLDGAVSTKNMVKRVAELGQPAVAQTNHGNLHGTYEFYQACKQMGVKPIIGLEAYVAPSSRSLRKAEKWGSPEQGRADISGGGAYTHLTLLAKTGAGVHNLFKLSSLSYSEGFYFKPRIDVDLLTEYSDGLIIGSGCLSGELLTRLALSQTEEADKYVANMKERFGDNFFIEVMDHGFEYEQQFIEPLLEIANRFDLRAVATNDSHYCGAQDSLLHDAMLCLGTNAKISDEKRMRFDGSGYYLRSRSEMDSLSLPSEALENTLWVAEQIGDYSEVFEHRVRMPSSGIENPEHVLREMCRTAMEKRPHSESDRERVEYELGVIIPQGYADYMLILEDICRYGRDNSIRIWFRGSAAASLVAYLIGIVAVDPMPHGLLFERFLNPERVSLPDVDLDVSARDRDKLLAYITSKYGAEYCARISSVGTLGAKKALNDGARVMGRPFGTGSRLAKSLPRAEFGVEPSLSQADMSVVDDEEVWDLATKLEGLVYAPGLHAAGFVISPLPLTDLIPTYIPERKSDIPATQWDMDAVSGVGLVKFDFLGAKILDVITDACAMAQTELPDLLDDGVTYKLLASGETLGCFQLDGTNMRALLRRVAPTQFADLAAVLALYRPGPMGVNAHLSYADRLNKREAVEYPHPELSTVLGPALNNTYGVIVYQEQVMRALQVVCGYTLAQADLVRKAMGKKDRALLNAERTRFLKGGKANGHSDEALSALWNTLVPFADYAFNKSHATAYAYTAYWTAWLKAHYPWEYMSAVLTHADTAQKDGKPSQAERYVSEVRRMGIPVLPPSVNGGAFWTPGNNGIHYGLSSIKGVGAKVLPGVLKGAPYRSWDDFLTRAPKAALNKGTVGALAAGGALDSFGSREGLLKTYSGAIDTALKTREENKRGERGFNSVKLTIPELAPNWPARRTQEMESLGVELSHPPCRVLVSRPLDASEWIFLHRVVGEARGGSLVTIEYGDWIMKTEFQSDPERLGALLKPLGLEVSV